MRRLLLAIQFLTILPVRVKGNVSEREISKSSAFFVLAGLLQGIFLIVTVNIGERFFQPELTVLLVLFAMVLSSGGLHLDGLADTFDAFALKSTGVPERDREKRLSAMKDSATGPIGVISIIFAILFKFFSLKNISYFIPSVYYSSLLLMPVFSKWTMTVGIFHGKAARDSGLGKLFIEGTGIREFFISTFILFATCGLIYIIFKYYLPNSWFIFCGAMTGALYILAILWLHICNKKFGGSTGDTLGALSEITEITFLLMVIIWQRLSI